ncbi:alpha/beta hydrolase [Nocardiopsis exhalans]|uniref:Alpha/beta hydrolase n=1 Tax=Nocardiopsis exhalans TaxID=163604 RepID=A0ABY5D7V6_9ACTN|nr:alpha/beta hydrolase [Nocardiopsis exhalans]USY18995.1 alpha/beta hydrolase [Nocardiopsis exhalans]
MKRALIVAAVVALVLVVLAGLMWAMQRSFVFIPMGGEPPPAAEVIEGAEDVRLHTEDGLELGAWFAQPQGTDRETAVLVANGNAGNRESRAPLARALAAEGFSVLLFDYRGYGGNPGSPSEAGLAMDARAAADALAERGFDAERTVYFGESLGAAVAANLASERPPAALFLRSPFSSLADMGNHHYPVVPVRLLLRDEFPVAERVAGIDVPTTVVVADADTIVPPEQSHEVAGASANLVEEVVLPGGGHNAPATIHGPEVVAAVARLADHAL